MQLTLTTPSGRCRFRLVIALLALLVLPAYSQHRVTHRDGAAATTGTPKLTVVSSYNFGSYKINDLYYQNLSFSSTGTAPLVISSISITSNDAGLFPGPLFNANGTSIFPLTLAPGASSSVVIVFFPLFAETYSGTATFVSNAGTTVVTLSAVGLNQTPYEVDLTWDAPGNSSDPVVGYNIYRATWGPHDEDESGAPYVRLNESPVVTFTSYVDLTVNNGINYAYKVTSVDAAGVESLPSNVYVTATP
jgi:hypothetical protein